MKSATPVLLCTTKYYSSTILHYKVLLQYYKVLLQYYSVLPPFVLLRTTKYSTTLYYKVLLQYYSVLPRTIPVLLFSTKYFFKAVGHRWCPVGGAKRFGHDLEVRTILSYVV